jgi:hypothetical protein
MTRYHNDTVAALDACRRVGWAKCYDAEQRAQQQQILIDAQAAALDRLIALVLQRRYKDAYHSAQLMRNGRRH